MPIYAPTLPPRPDLTKGDHPSLVIMRFDFRRTLRQKMGRFFGFIFFGMLVVQIGVLYFKYLVDTNQGFATIRDFANNVMTKGADYQADRLPAWMLFMLWFLLAWVGGGLVARDTLHRVRPLIYAHPVRPVDYLLAKGGYASLLPFAIQLPFILVPWAVSLLIAGKNGPIWLSAPLLLIPAAILNSLIMGTVALGASSMASTPRAGVGWVLGIVLGLGGISTMLAGLLNQPYWMALNPGALVDAWPKLVCGVKDPILGWGPTVVGTILHISLWTAIAWKRTRPSEAVL